MHAAVLGRRATCAGAAATLLGACMRAVPGRVTAGDPAAALRGLALAPGQALGAYVLDPATGQGFGIGADTRFAMCSTFKTSLAALTLLRVQDGAIDPAARIPYSAADLPEYSPVTSGRAAAGMTVLELAEAAQVLSDNGAANILLGRLGGPAALTAFWRSLGDTVTRLDDTEPALNHVSPGSVRNTTTPRAMARTLAALLLGPTLALRQRERLLAWMAATTTGKTRIRAGLPAGWWVGDKTGTGTGGALGFPAHYNDIALIRAPAGEQRIVAAFVRDTRSDMTRSSEADPIHAAIGRIAAHAIGGAT